MAHSVAPRSALALYRPGTCAFDRIETVGFNLLERCHFVRRPVLNVTWLPSIVEAADRLRSCRQSVYSALGPKLFSDRQWLDA